MSADDDWETAEVQLGNVNLEPKPKPQTTPVVIAPRLEQSIALSSFSNVPEKEVPIDDALITACENPRERMVVYQLEDMVLKFVKSPNEKVLEFPPGLNSFRRMVVYRLADRFGLLKEQINIDVNDKLIRLMRSSNTCIPRPLIIDYDSADSGSSATNITSSVTAAESGASETSGTTDTSAEPKKVVMLMKRKPGDGNSTSGKVNTNKPQLTAEDRERAYQEARARIFGEASASTSDNNGTAAASSSSPPPIITPTETQQSTSNGVNAGDASPSVPTAPPSTEESSNMKRSTSGGQINNMNNNGSNSGKFSRAQLRGSEAERSDPDFVRRTGNSGRYYNQNNSGQNSPYVRNGSSSGKYNANNYNYANNNAGVYAEGSSMSGLNPNASAWQQPSSYGNNFGGNYNNYYSNNNQGAGYAQPPPPPPSLVTPTSSSAGGNDPNFYNNNQGYYAASTGYGHPYYPSAPYPPYYPGASPMMVPPSTTSGNGNNNNGMYHQTAGMNTNGGYSPHGATNPGYGKRTPPPNNSQSDFPPLR